MDNLDHEFAGLDGVNHIHAQGLGLYLVGKLFCHLEVDVGLQQCAAHILEGFGYVDFGDFTFTFQYLETSFKSLA